MTQIPASNPTKVYLDAGTDDPKQARTELASLIDAVGTAFDHLRAGIWYSDTSTPLAAGDGVEVSSNALRVKLNGSSIDRSSSGIKVANSGVTANTYAYPVSVTVGADGRVTSITAGSAPTAGWTPLAELTASASASLDFTSVITGTYDCYALVLDKLRLATDQAELRLRVSSDNGSSWKTSSYSNSHIEIETGDSTLQTLRTTSASSIVLTRGSGGSESPGNATTDSVSGVIMIWPNTSAKHKSVLYDIVHNREATPSLCRVMGGGLWRGTTALTAVQAVPSSGSITSGIGRFYGIKNS